MIIFQLLLILRRIRKKKPNVSTAIELWTIFKKINRTGDLIYHSLKNIMKNLKKQIT